MKITVSQLEEIFSSAFNAKINLTEESDKNNIEEWDSINHLNLIVELEDRFNIKFSKEEIENINSVKKLVEIIGTK